MSAWVWQAPLAVVLIAYSVWQVRRLPSKVRAAIALKRETDALVADHKVRMADLRQRRNARPPREG